MVVVHNEARAGSVVNNVEKTFPIRPLVEHKRFKAFTSLVGLLFCDSGLTFTASGCDVSGGIISSYTPWQTV
jgi:hypothetical protein